MTFTLATRHWKEGCYTLRHATQHTSGLGLMAGSSPIGIAGRRCTW